MTKVDALFSSSYEEARRRFLNAANDANAAVRTYAHPDTSKGLFVDTARLGSPAASNLLIMLSGTHGQEGFAGSALQLALLEERPSLARDVGVLLIHAINPFGFKNKTRTTENNVDLNRHFTDLSRLDRSASELSAAIHKVLCVEATSAQALSLMNEGMKSLFEVHGGPAVEQAMIAQSWAKNGFFYTGIEKEWSRSVLEQISEAELKDVKTAFAVDWHVGLGKYGELFYLCFDDLQSAERERTKTWWGEKNIAMSDEGYDTGETPDYSGLLFTGLRTSAPQASIAGGVIEFGTCSNTEMMEAIVIDRWLRFVADPSSDAAAQAEAIMMERFCPTDKAWREAIIKQGLEVTRRAIDLLSSS